MNKRIVKKLLRNYWKADIKKDRVFYWYKKKIFNNTQFRNKAYKHELMSEYDIVCDDIGNYIIIGDE